MKQITKTIELGGKTLTLQTGKLAQQADGAVLATYGETVILATAVSAPMKQPLDYFPLMVDYMEKLYAGGRIKGSRWVKRDGRPSDSEILTGRLIDRSIRPLFPKELKKEVQIIVTVLSVDMENAPDIVAAIGVSAAIAASTIPWNGPVAPVRVSLKDGKYSLNPIDSELKASELDLVVTSTKKAVLMIEAGAKEVTEEGILGGIEYAFKESQKLLEFIEEFAKEVGNKKQVIAKEVKSADLEKKVKKLVGDKFKSIIPNMASKEMGGGEFDELKKAVMAEFDGKEVSQAAESFEYMFKSEVRKMILSGKRPDGRKHTEIRKLSAEVGVLPRTHGTGLFQRGQTQALTITTLGTPKLGQLIESAEGEEEKNYIHHYTFPPFSTGEVGRVGSPSRREIGHGALAERALLPVIPSKEVFPYTIQVVSEVMSSNGSTSMASTCGSTLSLMDAGVPITAPVSGIAMGLIVEDEENYSVLTDIIGLEDFNGDMDFKIAGTAKGITALQLDVKTLSLTPKILKAAIEQAKIARAEVLKVMLAAIPEPRKEVSAHAPKITEVKIPVESIGEIIGPGGRTIKKIIAETGAQVEVDDSGVVNISGVSSDAVSRATQTIKDMTKKVQPGEIYDGTVARIQPFGAFIEILPGKDGMVHVSDMGEAGEFVDKPESKVSIGQKVKVRVKEVDSMGRINLSMRMDPSTDKPKGERTGGDRGGERRSFGGDRGRGSFSPRGRSTFGREGGNRSGGFDRGRGRDSGARSGPHFPTSRLMGEQAPRGDRGGGRTGGNDRFSR